VADTKFTSRCANTNPPPQHLRPPTPPSPPKGGTVVRDPRKTPAPGDVLTNGRNIFYVTDVRDGEVFYTEDHPPVPVESVSLIEWVANAEGDQVLTTVEVRR